MSQGYVGQGPAAAVNRGGVKPCPKDGKKSSLGTDIWRKSNTDEGCLEPYYESDMKKNIVCNHPFDTAVGNTIGIKKYIPEPQPKYEGCFPQGGKCSTDIFPESTQCGGFTKEEGAKEIDTAVDDEINANWNQTGELKFRHVDYKVYRVFVNDSETGKFEYHALIKGCTCHTSEFYGEFCHIRDPNYDAWAMRSACFNLAAHVVTVVLAGLAVSWY